MARQGENIHKRKDGRWEARIITSYDNNKAVYKSLYGKSYQEVRTKKSQLELKKQNTYIDPEITFRQAAEQWLSSKKSTVKTSTYNHYSNQYHLHIDPAPFSSKKLTDLSSDDFNRFIRQKEDEGYAPRTILLLRTIIKMILYYSERQLHMPSIHGINMPKNPRKEAAAFSRQEQSGLYKYLLDHLDHYSLGVLLSLFCGLRIGEVCALQWKDIDLNNGVVTVSKTLIRVQSHEDSGESKTKIIIQTPKTDSSIRCVPIPDHIKELIIKNFTSEPEMFVITGDSSRMEPRIVSRKFKKILAELNMDSYSFHTCRHTYATRCVELGIDPKILSELLGHSSVKTTLDRYVHPSMDFKKTQVNKLVQLSDSKQIQNP